MKNLPDKIYLSFGEMSEERFEKEDYKELCEYSELVVPNKQKIWKTDAEYIRKDVFMKKACVKLKKLMYDNLMFQGRLHREDVIDNFVEDFKKYMEE